MEKESVIKSNIATEESELKKNATRILKGAVLAILISLVLLLIFAILLTYTSISENTIVPVIITIVGISILIGSTISTIKIKKNGLLNGGLVALIYVIMLYLASSICLAGFSLTANSIIFLIVGIVTGMVGGIIGVNLNRK